MTRRRVAALPVITTILLALPATAAASTVSVVGDRVVVMAPAGEVNHLDLRGGDSSAIEVTQWAFLAPLNAGAGCSAVDASTVSCPAVSIVRATVDSGDRDDTVVTEQLRLPTTVFGGPGDDRLIGSSTHGDELFGQDGADRLNGSDGSDVLDGGVGDDELEDDNTGGGAGDGADLLIGGSGRDSLAAYGGGADESLGGDGDDTLFGGRDDDVARGGDGEDIFELFGDTGADDVIGGAGRDEARYTRHAMAVTVTIDGKANDGNALDEADGRRDNIMTDVEDLSGSDGADSLTGSDGPNRIHDGDIYPGQWKDVIDGGAGDDDLEGGWGDDTVRAGSGDDLVAGGVGDDALAGGAGFDVADYSMVDTPVIVDLDGEPSDDGTEDEGDTIAADVEGALGGSANDLLLGGAGDNVLDGGAGDDLLAGSAGADRLDGADGDDLLDGGAGADRLDGGADDDLLDGGAEADQLRGGDGPDDIVDYSARSAAVTVDLDDAMGDDGELGEHDTVASDVENLVGGAGADTLVGSAGHNLLAGGPGPDTLVGLAGSDAADYTDRTTSVTADLDGEKADDGESGEGDTLASDIDDIYGGAAADRLTGNRNENFLVGGPGGDILDGRAGEDVLWGGAGDDDVRARDDQPDQASCGIDNDRLTADLKDVFTECEAAEILPAVSPPTTTTVAHPQPPAPTPAPPQPTSTVDTVPPITSTVLAGRRRLGTVRARGLALTLACSEACTYRIELGLARKVAKRLAAPKRIGTAMGRLTRPGTKRIVVELTASAKRRLARTRSLTITIRTTVSDAARNTRSTIHKVRLTK